MKRRNLIILAALAGVGVYIAIRRRKPSLENTQVSEDSTAAKGGSKKITSPANPRGAEISVEPIQRPANPNRGPQRGSGDDRDMMFSGFVS